MTTFRKGLAVMISAALVFVLSSAAGATGAHKGRRVDPSRSMLRNPAGPTPLNPAGPTPLNPAGPTPLNPTGRSFGFPSRAIVQPGISVGIVGSQEPVGLPLGGSFYCQVHNRGYATESLFFDHLAAADGMYGDEALSYLIDDGGVWIFPVE